MGGRDSYLINKYFARSHKSYNADGDAPDNEVVIMFLISCSTPNILSI